MTCPPASPWSATCWRSSTPSPAARPRPRSSSPAGTCRASRSALRTLSFQGGHLRALLGFSPYGGIVTWMPLFLFVLLFGLTMDYHVFILSRIRELRLRGWTTPQAITGGIGGSAGVVTSAAVIMVAVFSIFATLSLIEFKMFGVAMAAAVLIDATVVCGVLMPAAMSLLGERNWYLPGWLSWLPGRQKAVPATSGGGQEEMAGAATGG